MGMSNTTIEQINELIGRADKMSDLQFRLQLEELVSQGGSEVQNLVVHYITTSTLPAKTRINLIRIAGYLLMGAFIPPLQKVIHFASDPNLRIQAIISIAKFNDKRALEILKKSLDKITNPQLQEIINTQINQIKRNNPLINLMPKFLQGSHDPLLFQIVLKILKHILTAEDAKGFIPYLKHDDPLIENGALEILCRRGGDSVQFFVVEALRRKFHYYRVDRRIAAKMVPQLLKMLADYAERVPECLPILQTELTALHEFIPTEDTRALIQSLLNRSATR